MSEFNGRTMIRERYSRQQPRFVGLTVTFLDTDTVDGASRAMDSFAQLRSCDSVAAATDLPSLSEPLPVGTSVRGFRVGEEFGIIAMSGAGNLVIAFELEDQGVTDTLINDLVTRAAALLAKRPAVEPGEAVTRRGRSSAPTSNSD